MVWSMRHRLEPENTVPPFKEQTERNRMTSGFDLVNFHVYQAMIRRAFDQHPEYDRLKQSSFP